MPATLAGITDLDEPAIMEYYGWRISGTRRQVAGFAVSGALSCSGDKADRFNRILSDLRLHREVCRDWDPNLPDPLAGERIELTWREWEGRD